MQTAKPKPRTWGNIVYLLRIVLSIDPARVVFQFVEQLVAYGTWVFFSVYFLRYLLQAIEAGAPVESILVGVAACMAVLGVLVFLLTWYRARYQPLSNLKLNAALSRRLFAQAVRVDLDRYENEEFYNRFSLALKETESRVPEFLQQLAGSAGAAAAAVVTVFVLGQIDPWLWAFLLFPLIGNFVWGRWLNHLKYRRDLETSSSRRRIGYVNRVLYLPDYAKEIRLSKVMRLLLAHLEAGYGELFKLFRHYRNRAVGANFLFATFTFLMAFQGSFLYGAWLAIEKKSIDIGTFAVLASATVSASWMLLELSQKLIGLFQNSLAIENLRSFLEDEPRIVDAPAAGVAPRPFESLEFRDVSFAYEGRPEPVLSGLSFTVRAGDKIAVVGHNGAGKTSLVKLMMRLYEPTGGEVLYNGQPLSTYTLRSYRELFGTAFQDFRVFSLTVAENVLSRSPRDQSDYERVRTALSQSGVLEKVLALPKGLDTVLTREFADDGAQLSGGELQKIALARAFAADPEMVLLDEPSSALDPISEYKLYESIKQVWRAKTVLYISHRLSSATLADRILLLAHGRIVETGTHQELLARGGEYSRMFTMQAEHYLEENYATIAEADQ